MKEARVKWKSSDDVIESDVIKALEQKRSGLGEMGRRKRKEDGKGEGEREILRPVFAAGLGSRDEHALE
jgi:hypothetical protein